MDVEENHKLCSNNKKVLQNSEYCGCFYCITIYQPHLIREWCDKGETAICPYCGIDSVLPGEVIGIGLSLLKGMHERWFKVV